MIVNITPFKINRYKNMEGPYILFYSHDKNDINRNIVSAIERHDKEYFILTIIKMEWLDHKKYFFIENERECNRVSIYSKGKLVRDHCPPDLEQLSNMFKTCKSILDFNIIMFNKTAFDKEANERKIFFTLKNRKAQIKEIVNKFDIELEYDHKNKSYITKTCSKNNNINLSSSGNESQNKEIHKNSKLSYLVYNSRFKSLPKKIQNKKQSDMNTNGIKYFKYKPFQSKKNFKNHFIKKYSKNKNKKINNIINESLLKNKDMKIVLIKDLDKNMKNRQAGLLVVNDSKMNYICKKGYSLIKR